MLVRGYVPSCLQAAPTGPGAGGPAIPDNSRQSLLLLRGERAVHGLYDFLLNDASHAMGPSGGAAASTSMAAAAAATAEQPWDLPQLVAPVPFEGGAVSRPLVKASTRSRCTACCMQGN